MSNSDQVEAYVLYLREATRRIKFGLPKGFWIKSTNSSPFSPPLTCRRIPLNKTFKE